MQVHHNGGMSFPDGSRPGAQAMGVLRMLESVEYSFPGRLDGRATVGPM